MMPWVRFLETYRWKPPERNGAVVIRFEAKTYLVRRACADAAIAAGKAVPADRVKREAAR